MPFSGSELGKPRAPGVIQAKLGGSFAGKTAFVVTILTGSLRLVSKGR